MKPSVAVALIVMGALLIMTPPASDYLHQRLVVSLMAKSETIRVTLQGVMTETYRFGCWIAGIAMILVAVVGSLGGRGRTTPAGKT